MFSFTKLFRSRDAKAAAAAEAPAGPPQPTIYARADHPVSRSNISPAALKVLYRLKDSGYQGFLVGGAVRDLLLDVQPKDFDIATDAHPEDVRRTFRNCRLIGRRFHLAHVRFGHEIIEVATFRAAHTEIDEDHGVDEVEHRAIDEHGRILRDNLYGTIEEDVWRRDFTANALYYNIEDYSIWDYVGGVEDARNRVLRLIGDPATRYREDPVRMLRAARFAAKLNFTLHPGTEAPIGELAYMLDRMPAARLFDETLKLMLSGHAEASLEWLIRLELLPHLMPDVAAALEAAPESAGARLVQLGLEGTDDRVHDDKSVTPTFLFAVLLWPAILRALGTPDGPLPDDPQRLLDASDKVIGRQLQRIALPKRFSLPMRELIMLQTRFERRSGRRALRLLEHPRFRAAYDFLLLRAESGEVDPELAAVVDRPAGRLGRRSPRDGREPSGVASRAEAAEERSRRAAAVVRAVVASLPVRPRRRDRGPCACTRRDRRSRAGCRRTSRSAAISPNPRAQVARAFEALAALPATRLMLRSSLYRSRPLGPVEQPDFVNAAAALLTQLDRARRCCVNSRRWKPGSGAQRPVVRWGPRLIDLDLLVHGSTRCSDATLTVPHPGIAERDFVLRAAGRDLPVPRRAGRW